jgi:hypothetical protein
MGMIIKRVSFIMILKKMEKNHCRNRLVHRKPEELPTLAKKTHPPTTQNYHSVVGSVT